MRCDLSEGHLVDHVVQCASDQSEFDVRDGSVVRHPPARGLFGRLIDGPLPMRRKGRVADPIMAFTPRMDGDKVYIKVDDEGVPVPINPPEAEEEDGKPAAAKARG